MKPVVFQSEDILEGYIDEAEYMDFPVDEAHATVVIAPGGAWHHVTVGPEGVTVAKWLNSIGIAARVIRYRLPRPGLRYPAPMDDGREAVEMVRSEAETLGVDPGKVGMLGFSVGGQIAGCLAVQEKTSGKPDFVMLIYPVVSMYERSTFFCRDRLFDANASKQLLDETSIDKNVGGDMPPMFLAHALDDALVSILGPHWLLQAMIKKHNKDDFMGVISEQGGHGLRGGLLCGLPEERDDTWPAWPDKCEEWLRHIGVLPKKSGKNT